MSEGVVALGVVRGARNQRRTRETTTYRTEELRLQTEEGPESSEGLG